MIFLKTSSRFWLIFSLMTFLISCKENNHKQEITQIIQEWQGKEIVFPENIIFTQYGKDTIPFQISDSEYKVVIYVDSVGCTSCRLQLHKWKELIEEVDSLSNETVPVLFFFHPKDIREISYLLKRDDITIPVCIDEKDHFNTINNFPTNHSFQCFLLDKNNKVVFIGNPVHNMRIKDMYLSQIASGIEIATPLSENTTVRIEQTDFDLGTMKRGEAAIVKTKIYNTGDAPFKIHNLEASCECTTVEYKQGVISPNKALELEITQIAEDKGEFFRVVYIYGNTEQSPLTIMLEGEVI
jgi:LEA14-like dessication related protein